MEPSSKALTDIINTVEPICRNIGEATTGGALAAGLYATGNAALTNNTLYESLQSPPTVSAGIVGGIAAMSGTPIDNESAQTVIEYIGASAGGAATGATLGPMYQSMTERQPFYQDWQDKARRSAIRGAISLPAAYGALHGINSLL
jgi:hypothetical protein